MTIRLGINGFGRIGRAVTRILHGRNDFELVAINDLTSPEQLAHGLKYDSVYRGFPGEVSVEKGNLRIGSWHARVTAEKDPGNLDWGALKVDMVLEATGAFRKREPLERHLKAGAGRVVLSVPPKEALDATIVMGVNDFLLDGSQRLVSNASCTTNAAAPVTKVIHDSFGIERGFVNTIHAYTNGQRLVDYPHRDWRRSRSASLSIIPTTTGAARAVTQVIPALAGRLDGMAYRVPVPVGSIVDMVFQVQMQVTVETVNQALKAAAENQLKGIMAYGTDPIVSADIIQNPHSSIVDAPLTQVLDNGLVKLASWYDNEWGYSSRLVDLMLKMTSF